MYSLKSIGIIALVVAAMTILFSSGPFSNEMNDKKGNKNMQTLGYKLFGSGKEKVLVLHNWFCDSSSYDPLLPYLDTEKFTYALVDLRGYGLSKELPGEHSVKEASRDAIAVVDSLSWEQFHIVGHSMSGMIAQKIAAENSSRVKSVVAITPVPASGSPKPQELMAFLEMAAQDNDNNAVDCMHLLTGRRLSDGTIKKMVQDWRSCSKAEARVGYLHMFSDTDFSNEVNGLQTPILVIYGEYDFEGKAAEEAIKNTFLKWYPNAHMECCEGAGHFPTQETPIYLAGRIENFLSSHSE